MNKAKKTLAAITATVLSASSFFCTNLTAFAETDETDRSLADSLTIDECIDYVNEMNSIAEQNAPEVGIYATPISKEDGEILQRVLENDYYSTEGFDYTYKYQKYDFSSEYYYDQLPSHLKKAYAQLDKACSEFLTSSVNLSSGVFQTVMFDSPLASEDELLQLYRCFYYSNPQYFFLGNGVSYYSDYSGIALKTYDNCQNASKKATIKNSIDSLTDSYINSVSSLNGDVAKETAIAKKISDLVDYDLSADYNQSMMSALYYNKSVCNGYAMSMNYFCNALGIECITVTSTGHAWNRVKLNGEWYEVDVTWYDQTDNSTKYWDIWLNKSTATFLKNDSDDSHVVEIGEDMYKNITLPSCTDDDPSDNINDDPSSMPNVNRAAAEAFVERLYENVLDRGADGPGKENWVNQLMNGETAVNVAYGFIHSPEFLVNRTLTNRERVSVFYNTFLDRGADEPGMQNWLAQLNNGCSIDSLFYGFSQSPEFTKICDNYGIVRGDFIVTEPRDKNLNLSAYVSRMYTKALGRSFDPDGMNNWTGLYLDHKTTADGIAEGFIYSQEFVNRNLNDEEYVEVLYQTFFDRGSDEVGKNNWLSQLHSGATRADVLNGFLGSEEYKNLVASFGI